LYLFWQAMVMASKVATTIHRIPDMEYFLNLNSI
jgi:hypothetical protein